MSRFADPFAGSGLSGYPRCLLGDARGSGDYASGVSLTPNELERLAQLKDNARRQELDASLKLRRCLAANLIGCLPNEVRITTTDSGAPLLAEPVRYSLNLATKGPWTFLAIDDDGSNIGSDVEIHRPINWSAMLDMVCSVEEAGGFVAQHDAEDVAIADFFRLWTIKEAILKATGEGFRAGPKNIHVPDALYSETAHGVVSALGGRFEVWALDREGLALSLARQIG